MKVQDGCKQCGSPWCLYDNNQDTIDNVIDDIKHKKNVNNKAKRLFAYQRVVQLTDDDGNGWRNLDECTTKAARSAFPSSDYVGFVQK